MARRNATRRSSWSATFSATSCASMSGRRTSWMLMKHSRLVSLPSSLLQLLDLGALLADHDARTRGVDVDLRLVGGALDLDLGDARVVEAALDEHADADVLVQQRGVVAVRVPLRVPALDHTEAKSLRMYLPAHATPRSARLAVRSSTTTVMWLDRLMTRVARPCARGRKRFSVTPASTVRGLHVERVDVDPLRVPRRWRSPTSGSSRSPPMPDGG